MEHNAFAAYNQALYEFWSSFLHEGEPIPVHVSGHVPSDQEDDFPYWTYEVKQGAYGSTAIATAIVWFKHYPEDAAWVHINNVMGMVQNAIPEGGRWLTFVGGAVLLRRNDANFISSYDPEQEDGDNVTAMPIRGGRVSYTIQFFVR